MSKNRALYIFIQDDDTCEFTVVGPVEHDSVNEWIEKEAEARNEGRHVSVFEYFEESLLMAAKEAIARQYTPVEGEKIINFPKDRSAEYRGELPKYAQNADRSKLVHILCKGKCRALRWAELDTMYPGKEVLKNAPMGTFRAVCLRCGTTARDNYNWTR